MNASPSIIPGICPECGAKVTIKAPKCWMCQRSLSWDTPLIARPSVTAASGAEVSCEAWYPAGRRSENAYEHRATFQFGLSSIMMIITLAAVLSGVYAMAPGLGIAMVIVAAPALICTCIISMRKGARGRPLSPSEQIAYFVAWLGLAILIIIAAGVAFFVSCFTGVMVSNPGFNPNINPTGVFIVSGIAAFIAAVFVAILFLRKFSD